MRLATVTATITRLRRNLTRDQEFEVKVRKTVEMIRNRTGRRPYGMALLVHAKPE